MCKVSDPKSLSTSWLQSGPHFPVADVRSKEVERDLLFEAFIAKENANVMRSARMRYYGPLYDVLFGKIDRSGDDPEAVRRREMRPLHDDGTNERARRLVASFNEASPGRQLKMLKARRYSKA